MPDTLSVAVYGRNRLDDKSSWAAILGEVERAAPVLVPVRWGEGEPPRERWVDAETAAARATGPMAFRGKTASGGTVHILKRQMPFDLHTWYEMNVPFEGVEPAAVVSMFKAIAAIMDANYGHLHLLHPPAWGDTHLRFARVYDGEARLSVPPWLLELYLPGIYWGTILGPDYVGLFGRDTIAGAPCEVVEDIGDDRFYLQTTADLNDCRDANDRYVDAAREVMDHLGHDAFVDLADYRRIGRTPDLSYLRDTDPPRPYKPLVP
ncbi:MAG: hypothetical protein GEU71_00870 [Actinobacteria bacterium]|nr:hypothetical protein [Actinomycetota bacterium]